MNLQSFLITFSACSFIFFGLGCFLSPKMKTEFLRYGLDDKRFLVGALQLTGAIGLILGYLFSPLVCLVSALGLCLLMILGFGVRLKIRDSFVQSAPAFLYAALNGYIALVIIQGLQAN